MADVLLMAGKSILVTGGWGYRQGHRHGLAALGARVGITGRYQARTGVAAAGIRAAPGSSAMDASAADMSAAAGMRRLAAHVLDALKERGLPLPGGCWELQRIRLPPDEGGPNGDRV
jgi:hypothetical protein